MDILQAYLNHRAKLQGQILFVPSPLSQGNQVAFVPKILQQQLNVLGESLADGKSFAREKWFGERLKNIAG